MFKRVSWLGLFLAIAGVFAYLLRRRWLARLLNLPPARYHVAVDRFIRIPMPDGVFLVADHYRPVASGMYPALLIRTPYGRGGLIGMRNQFLAQRFAERGYHVICQDVRGRFDSEGEFEPYVNESLDGRATLEWLASQPWFNGMVGMWGASYVGYVQWAAAVTGSHHLKAMVPIITQANLGQRMEHGFSLDRALRWLLLLHAMEDESMPFWLRLGRSVHADLQDELLVPAFSHLPLKTADEIVLGHPVPFYRTWFEHPRSSDPYWRSVDFTSHVSQMTLPVHLVGGWYDIFLSGMLADYEAMHLAGMEPYLTVGPWHHLALECHLTGLREGLAWFEVHLKGNKNQLRPKAVRIYVMGADEWRDYDEWPPPAQETNYFLQASGQLAKDFPPSISTADKYIYDPANPTPNIGGALLSSRSGAYDNRTLEVRPDVLTYTTPPLEEDLEVIGPVTLVLFIRSNRAHTDFHGRLCDVHPDGRSINICDGLYRIESGRGELQTDGSQRIEVDMSATAQLFLRGHRIRLQVSSGAHPRIARNLGTGEPEGQGTRLLPAEQSVYHDAEHPSILKLPITRPS